MFYFDTDRKALARIYKNANAAFTVFQPIAVINNSVYVQKNETLLQSGKAELTALAFFLCV